MPSAQPNVKHAYEFLGGPFCGAKPLLRDDAPPPTNLKMIDHEGLTHVYFHLMDSNKYYHDTLAFPKLLKPSE